jgi:hypothetical protein
MQTIIIQITDESAIKTLQDLEEKRFIKIVNEPKEFSPFLPGKPLSSEEFKDWITEAEKADTISLKEAKTVWTRKRRQLLKLVK